MVFGLALIAAFVLTYLARFIPIMDIPKAERQLHTTPVPRSGGLAMMGVLLAVGIGYFAIIQDDMTPKGWGLLAIMFCGFIIGLIDDVMTISVSLKAMALAVVSALAALLFPLAEMYLPGVGVVELPFLVSLAGVLLWVFTFTNIANFMDGANGLAFSAMAIMFASLAILSAASWGPDESGLMWLSCFVVLGFVAWNFSGRIFAGDSGSLSMGFGVACCALIIANSFGVWCVATIALPFLVDGLLTMADRAKRGENIFIAHSDHVYQRLIKSGWRHWQSSLIYSLATLICAAIALYGALMGDFMSFAGFAVTLIVLSLAWAAARVKLTAMKPASR